MQLEKYIHVESEAIPLDFCDEIIKEYDDDEYERGTINDYETSKYRQCDVIILSDKKIIQRNNKSRNNIDKKIYNIINKNIDKYLQDYATLNFNSPVEEFISNKSESLPPLMVQVTSPLRVKVLVIVLFSSILISSPIATA